MWTIALIISETLDNFIVENRIRGHTPAGKFLFTGSGFRLSSLERRIPLELGDQLELLTLPCNLSTSDLCIALKPIGDWSMQLLIEGRLIYCQKVIPIRRYWYSTSALRIRPA